MPTRTPDRTIGHLAGTRSTQTASGSTATVRPDIRAPGTIPVTPTPSHITTVAAIAASASARHRPTTPAAESRAKNDTRVTPAARTCSRLATTNCSTGHANGAMV